MKPAVWLPRKVKEVHFEIRRGIFTGFAGWLMANTQSPHFLLSAIETNIEHLEKNILTLLHLSAKGLMDTSETPQVLHPRIEARLPVTGCDWNDIVNLSIIPLYKGTMLREHCKFDCAAAPVPSLEINPFYLGTA